MFSPFLLIFSSRACASHASFDLVLVVAGQAIGPCRGEGNVLGGAALLSVLPDATLLADG